MDFLGQYSDRKVYWLDYDRFMTDLLPNKDWICLAIADHLPDITLFDKFVRTTISNGIVDFKGHGTCGEKLHDLFDETMNVMIVMEACKDPEVMTTWSTNGSLANTFWECFFATALPDSADYDNITIVCTDLEGVDRRSELQQYLIKFESGWLPSDEKN